MTGRVVENAGIPKTEEAKPPAVHVVILRDAVHMGYTTWLAMYGNGVRIGMMKMPMTDIRRETLRSHRADRGAFCGVVHGSAPIRIASVAPVANTTAGSTRPTATTTTAFVVRGVSDYTLHSYSANRPYVLSSSYSHLNGACQASLRLISVSVI